MEVCDIVQATGIKTIFMEKKCKKAKWLSEEALQIAVKRREAKCKREKERYKHLNAEFQRIARREKKAFLSHQCKEIEENNRMGKTIEISSRKLEIPKEHFMQVQFCSVAQVVSNYLQPHESQHARPPCPSPTPGVHPKLCPSSH